MVCKAVFCWCCFPSANYEKRNFKLLWSIIMCWATKESKMQLQVLEGLIFQWFINLLLLKLRKQKLSLQYLHINYIYVKQ